MQRVKHIFLSPQNPRIIAETILLFINKYQIKLLGKTMKKWGLTIMALLLSQQLFANQNWDQWVLGVREEAIQQGIPPRLFDDAFAGIKEPSRQVKGLMRNQPEHRLTFMKYRTTRADNYRIAIGRREYKKNKELLEKIGQEYGVNPCFIVSFWAWKPVMVPIWAISQWLNL